MNASTIVDSIVNPVAALSAKTSATLFTLRAAMLVRRQRRALMALDERTLADLGLSRSQAYAESSRSMFDLPNRHR